MQIPFRSLVLLLVAVVCFAQQTGREEMREEALTQEQFRRATHPSSSRAAPKPMPPRSRSASPLRRARQTWGQRFGRTS